jgi:hypothetical protein
MKRKSPKPTPKKKLLRSVYWAMHPGTLAFARAMVKWSDDFGQDPYDAVLLMYWHAWTANDEEDVRIEALEDLQRLVDKRRT